MIDLGAMPLPGATMALTLAALFIGSIISGLVGFGFRWPRWPSARRRRRTHARRQRYDRRQGGEDVVIAHG
jgi:hypothetical protein